MAEDSVTIVRCLKCSYSGHLSLVGGRFWCAWCNDWSEIEAEQLQDRVVDRSGLRPELRAPPESGYRLQPLRIPAGWHVQYNNGLYEVDPIADSVPEDDRWYVFKQDLLQLRYPHFDRLLDVGWHPDGDLVAGAYRLVVYEGDFMGRLLHEYHTRSRQELVSEIERLLELIRSSQL